MNTVPSPPPRKRGPPRRIVVSGIEPLSPLMRRIHFQGDDLAQFEWRGPAGHLKLIVPEEGQREAPMPSPEGPRSPFMRTYTPRAFDAATRTLTIDFVLHAHGPAGRWATRAAIGDRLAMMGPAPGYTIDAATEWMLIAGDQTALPAIESLLERLPAATAARVFIEIANANEQRPVTHHANVQVSWLVADGAAAPGSVLFDAIAALGAWPSGQGRAYIGCEAMAVRRIRALLRERYGLSNAQMVTRGYWQQGEQNHPDHDYGE